MSDCKKCKDLFDEAFYEELNKEQRDFFKSHVESCEACQAAYAEMTSTLKIMEKRTRPEPEQAYWNDYWNRLARRMEEEDTSTSKTESWWRSFSRIFTLAPKWSFQVAASLLLVVLGIFLGKMIFSPSGPAVQRARQLPAISSQVESVPEYIHRAQDYIERSKLIILALVNFDPKTEDPYALNLPYQQQVSKELVREARFLKRGIADSGQRRLQNLISDLEVILLQVANLESVSDLEAIELVKEGVESRGILMQIYVTDFSRYKKIRDKTTPSPTASDTSQIM
jgi:hypothetical protein